MSKNQLPYMTRFYLTLTNPQQIIAYIISVIIWYGFHWIIPDKWVAGKGGIFLSPTDPGWFFLIPIVYLLITAWMACEKE